MESTKTFWKPPSTQLERMCIKIQRFYNKHVLYLSVWCCLNVWSFHDLFDTKFKYWRSREGLDIWRIILFGSWICRSPESGDLFTFQWQAFFGQRTFYAHWLFTPGQTMVLPGWPRWSRDPPVIRDNRPFQTSIRPWDPSAFGNFIFYYNQDACRRSSHRITNLEIQEFHKPPRALWVCQDDTARSPGHLERILGVLYGNFRLGNKSRH